MQKHQVQKQNWMVTKKPTEVVQVVKKEDFVEYEVNGLIMDQKADRQIRGYAGNAAAFLSDASTGGIEALDRSVVILNGVTQVLHQTAKANLQAGIENNKKTLNGAEVAMTRWGVVPKSTKQRTGVRLAPPRKEPEVTFVE